MSTATILPRTKDATPTEALAEALEITTGRILKVMCTSWSDSRVSYRISVEQDGTLTTVHRLRQECETTGINDALWTLAGGRWKMRPAYQGAGFIVFHPEYANFISSAGSCAELFA